MHKKLAQRILTICFSLLLFASCYSTSNLANINELPQNAADIDFEKLAKKLWMRDKSYEALDTINEYYFESIYDKSELKIDSCIKTALRKNNYRIVLSNAENNCIIGKRGMGPVSNEINSMTGVYYKQAAPAVKFYIRTKIKVDVTGGFKENRAKEVGQVIIRELFRK